MDGRRPNFRSGSAEGLIRSGTPCSTSHAFCRAPVLGFTEVSVLSVCPVLTGWVFSLFLALQGEHAPSSGSSFHGCSFMLAPQGCDKACAWGKSRPDGERCTFSFTILGCL